MGTNTVCAVCPVFNNLLHFWDFLVEKEAERDKEGKGEGLGRRGKG